MAFCATCGSQVEGRFCAKCGTPVAAAPAVGVGSTPQPGPVPPVGAAPYAPAAAGMSDAAASGLAYLVGFITGILFLVLEPYNRNRTVRFHAFQSIFLNIAWFAVWIALSIVMSILGAVLGVFSFFFLTPLIGLAFFVVWLWVMISAFQGKAVVLPIIGPLAQKQA
ncbi:MAG: hypothetical protein LAQ30_24100 [Acidobacteriia bacterium]|nr:hypothetical protein [Terriglobia bacterium]